MMKQKNNQNASTTSQTFITGVVYQYTLSIPGVPHTGWSYIGETTNEYKRKSAFFSVNNSNYSGKLINDAREYYGVDKLSWDYKVLLTVSETSKKELKKKLVELEKQYIANYRATGQLLFNSNNGGKGRGIGCKNKKKASVSKSYKGQNTFITKCPNMESFSTWII